MIFFVSTVPTVDRNSEIGTLRLMEYSHVIMIIETCGLSTVCTSRTNFFSQLFCISGRFPNPKQAYILVIFERPPFLPLLLSPEANKSQAEFAFSLFLFLLFCV